jgi:hypothetical protein
MNKTKNKLILLLSLTTASILSGCANFALTSAPDANVIENGKIISQTPYKFVLNTGERQLTVQKDGYVQHDVTIRSIDRSKTRVKLVKVAETVLTTKPSGAKISNKVDGQTLGISPKIFKLDRPVTVKISKEGYEAEEIELSPNNKHLVELRPIEGWQPIMSKDITIKSKPAGAKVYNRATETVLGTTPFTRSIDFGSDIEFIKEGFVTKSVRITRDTPDELEVTLGTIPEITITSEPGTEIYRLGGLEKIGKVPYTTQVMTETTLELHNDKFYPKTIAVTPSTISNLNVPLKAKAFITINTQPVGATLYRLGGIEKIGTAPYKTLIEYERTFEIRHPGYYSKIIAVGPDSPAKTEIILQEIPEQTHDAAAVSDSMIDENYPQF